jgi:hypothetical protein
MLSKSMLAMAEKVVAADIHYGKRLSKARVVDAKRAVKKLEAGDIVVQFVPQLAPKKDYYNEYLLRGCMHIATIAMFGGKPYKVEMMQQGLFVVDDIFGDLDGEVIYMKRYNIVLRHKKLKCDPALRAAINESILRFAGYEDHGGVPVRTRRVFPNAFLKTHRLEGKKRDELPRKLYCSELTYQAYKRCGIEICKLHTMDDLIKRSGGYPEREYRKRTVRRYAKMSMLNYYAFLFLSDLELVGRLLHLKILRPSLAVFGDVAWPLYLLENPAFDIELIVPPSEVYITQWIRMLNAGEEMAPEITA